MGGRTEGRRDRTGVCEVEMQSGRWDAEREVGEEGGGGEEGGDVERGEIERERAGGMESGHLFTIHNGTRAHGMELGQMT